MKNIINDLYKLNPQLLGVGYDNCIKYIQHLIDLKVLEFSSGTKFESWTVPNEWVVRRLG